MKLTDSERVWAPEDRPDYLIVLKKTQTFPRNREQYLEAAADLLARLVDEAGEEEVEGANRRLADSLPQSHWIGLPMEGLKDRRTIRALLLGPAELGSPLHEWKSEIEEVLEAKAMPEDEALTELDELSLEGFLSRLL